MKYLLKINTVRVLVGVAAMFTLMLVACGGADAPATPPAAAQLQPTATPIQQATPTAAATATPLPSGVTSARDSITLVVPEEPIGLNSLGTIGAALNASITRANLQDALTWQSGDDLRIVPTSGTESWEQVDSDTWRFQLRKGVKFHNGEPWNAQAALPSLASVGSATSEGGSINYTGAFDAEAVGEYTIDINCEDGCPIFPSASFFVNFEAPAWLADTSEEERVRQSIGFGPYKHVDWKPGVSITQEAYDGYVTVGDHFEFQKPFIKNVTWLWRGETVVIAAMVQTAEADIGWDIGVDTIGSLPPNMIKSGSSAESYALTTNTIWHPELKKKKVRQAMVHAINCAEMVEFLYSGYTTCRGNIIWPGIIGASERNTAPYKFDPELARQLLKEANYNPENKMTIVSRGTRIPKQLEVAESLQAFWINVGINVDFRVVEPSIRSALTKCGVGKAVQEILEAAGKDPKVDKPTNADFQAALDKGGADCPTGDLIGNQPSNETLDFGRQVRYYMNCFAIRSLICDPSSGGIQDQIAPALSASGDERQRLLEALADRFHDDVLFIPLFDLPVFYAVNPKLNWEPRLDPNVRVSTMWFSK
jgi:peptide/nickel transport system substrate-binding protein